MSLLKATCEVTNTVFGLFYSRGSKGFPPNAQPIQVKRLCMCIRFLNKRTKRSVDLGRHSTEKKRGPN